MNSILLNLLELKCPVASFFSWDSAQQLSFCPNSLPFSYMVHAPTSYKWGELPLFSGVVHPNYPFLLGPFIRASHVPDHFITSFLGPKNVNWPKHIPAGTCEMSTSKEISPAMGENKV